MRTPRLRPIRKRKFVTPETVPDPPIETVVDDGVLIALAGIRMTVRNIMLVRALRDGADFDENWYVDAVKHEFRALAAEKRSDAERATTERASAANRPGKSTGQGDYRSDSVPRLDRRSAALELVAGRLELLGADDDTATTLVKTAREAALDDIANAIRPEGPALAAIDEKTRRTRMDLVARDLALLALPEY